MKKCIRALVVVLICTILCLSGNINAAKLDIQSISANQILGINTFKMNAPSQIVLDRSTIKTYKATFDYYYGDGDGDEMCRPILLLDVLYFST